VGGQHLLELRHLGLQPVDDRDGVGTRLLADQELHGVLAVQARETARLDDAVLGIAHVADVQRAVTDVSDDQVIEFPDLLDAAHGADDELAARLVDAATGELDVLLRDRLPHLADREALGRQPVGIDVDVDGALLATDEDHLADAGERLDDFLHLAACQLGHLAEAPAARHRDAHDRRRIDVELVDDGRVGPGRELRQHRRHLVADVLRRHLARLLEDELHDHARDALARRALQDVDALDRVDRLLDDLRDAGLHLLDARALQRGGDGDDREVDVREEIDAERAVAEEPEDDEGPDQHGREDGAADEDVGEAHQAPGAPSPRTCTWVPSASFESPLVATCWPFDTPCVISTQPSPRSTPSATSCSRATPSSTTKSFVTPANVVTALRGTATARSSFRMTISARPKKPGLSRRSAFGTS